MRGNLAHRRLRVLQVARDAGYGGIGGAEILVLEFARRLDPARFDSYLCTTRRPEPDRLDLTRVEAAELAAGGVRVLTLDRRSSASLVPWGRLLGLLVRERIDIVHAHMPRANIPAAVLARLAGVPVVIAHEHGSVRYGERLRATLNRHVVGGLSDTVLAVSDWDRRRLIEHEAMPPGRVQVFRHGIAPLASDPPDVREELGPAEVPVIGALGRLDPVKGYGDLIAAVGILTRDGTPVTCAIAGVGPDEERLRQMVGAAGLEGQVRFLGLRDDVPSLLRAFDIAVMPSHSEGAPLAIIEYMAAGLPIVATGVGGIPELVTAEREALLVAPRDPPALAAALRRLIGDPSLAGRLGAAARLRQRHEFDLDVAVGRLQELYVTLHERAIAAGRRSPGRRPGRPWVRRR